MKQTSRRGSSFWQHIGTLLWKNRLLKMRHPVFTIMEIFIPTIFIVAFGVIKTLQPNISVPAGYSSSQHATDSTTGMSFGLFGFGNYMRVLGNDLMLPQYVATESTMSAILLGLAMQSFLEGNLTSLPSQAYDTCKAKSTYMGFINNDKNSPYAIPTECAGKIVPYKIAIAPKNLFTQNYFSAAMSAWYPQIPLTSQTMNNTSVYGSSVPCIPAWNDSVVFFDSNEALESYIAGQSYGSDMNSVKLYGAIVFNKFPADNAIGQNSNFEYTLRFNSSSNGIGASGTVPRTKGENAEEDGLEKSIPTDDYASYATKGFNTIQTMISRFITCQPQWDPVTKTTTGDCQQPNSQALMTMNNTMQFSNQLMNDMLLQSGFGTLTKDTVVKNQLPQPMNFTSIPARSLQLLLRPLRQAPQSFLGSNTYPLPVESYVSAPFYSTVSSVFPLIFVITYLYAVSKILVVLILEKETKSRELMKILGVGESPIVISWYITYFIIFLVGSIFQGILARACLFPNSDAGMLFVFFFLFGLSVLAYGYLVSTLFSNAKTGSFFGMVVFFIMYFVTSSFSSETAEQQKNGGCIFAPVAMALCIQTLSSLESVSSGLSRTTGVSLINNFRFNTGLGMLVFDIILYTLLGIYLEQVIPKDYGVTEKWYFFLLPSYWCRNKRPATVKYGNNKVNDICAPNTVVDANIEPVSNELLAQESSGEALQIKGIYKTFQVPGGTKVAVNKVNLTMYNDQITCLLGHNGAGKTTLMSILTGMIPTTEGDAFFNNYSITSNMREIRKSLGMCPQHDVLYSDLTVEEHLLFYGRVKGYFGKDLKDVVDKKIREVGLMEKRKVFSNQLSGGMKRKLSVAIALLGDSKLVFLDEPTSGMDPYSRRSTWELIQNNRQGRVMVLTTHFMDEADILGDRVAIMSEGKIRCCGSSLFLKTKFGAGYNLTIVKKPASSNDTTSTAEYDYKLTEFVHSFVPHANIISNVGAEIAFQLSIESSSTFPAMFKQLEQSFDEFHILSFGISVTTLEEVFIKVAECSDEHGQHTLSKAAVRDGNGASKNYKLDASKQMSNLHLFVIHFCALFQKRFRVAKRDRKVIIFSTLLPIILMATGFALLTSSSVLKNDPKVCLNTHLYKSGKQTSIPFVCMKDDGQVCTNTLSNNANSNNYQYGTPAALVTLDWSTNVAADSFSIFNVSYDFRDRLIQSFLNPQTNILTAKRIFDAAYGYQPYSTPASSNQYGGYLVYGSAQERIFSYNLFVNTTAYHSAAMYKALLDESYYRYITSNTALNITVNDHPFPISASTRALLNSFFSFTACLFIVIAMTYFPASIITYLVKEKQMQHNSKHQQLVSGVSLPAFWCSNYVWDLCVYVIPLASAMILISTFNISALTQCSTCPSNTPAAVFVLFLLFGFAICPFTYCMSYIFKEHSSSQFYTQLINTFLGLILMVLSFVLDVASQSSKDANSYLKYIWRFSPLFSLGNGLLNLAVANILASFMNRPSQFDAFDWTLTGYEIFYLATTSIFFFLVAIGIDLIFSYPKVNTFFRKEPVVKDPAFEEDKDVVEEAKRIESLKSTSYSNANDDLIIIKNLRKVYTGNKIALRNLSFGLKKGECFGYLGINGAGKTTTMKILTGDVLPSSGQATLGGFDIMTQQIQVRRLIGYCPQFDALIDLLSVREHLELFAKIKGIPAQDVKLVVDEKIKQMNLADFEHKLAGTLSGGNKRKLSVAIAMIGSPPIIFLDEPSTGMDPVSRRFMWDVIANVSTTNKESTIILTTHSMEECEALCSIVGIMVGGRLRCLGSVQHLKSRFGDGFMIDAKLVLPNHDEIVQFYNEQLKNKFNITDKTTFETVTITKEQIKEVCTNGLGKESTGSINRFEWVTSSHPTGYVLDSVIQRDGFVSMSLFISWWIGENRFEKLQTFFNSKFGEGQAQLIERQNDHCRFKIFGKKAASGSTGQGLLLSSVFETIETNKADIYLREYSVSQTTLEQIFNSFASQQSEETIVARGVNK